MRMIPTFKYHIEYDGMECNKQKIIYMPNIINFEDQHMLADFLILIRKPKNE